MKLIKVFMFSLLSFSFFILPTHASDQTSINKILIVVAMEMEAKPIIQKLNLKKIANAFPGLPMQAYAGRERDKDIFLVLNGKDPIHHVDSVATQPAVLATYLGIERFHPDLVISAGTAGGLKAKGSQSNDIYISEKIYFFDRRIGDNHEQYGLVGFPLRHLQILPIK